MKRKLEEMESENHENFPLVMEMVKGYCEEKEEKKKEPEEDKNKKNKICLLLQSRLGGAEWLLQHYVSTPDKTED
ncbi:hypothetical protein Tco_0861813 [Tanacetum coccineum]